MDTMGTRVLLVVRYNEHEKGEQVLLLNLLRSTSSVVT